MSAEHVDSAELFKSYFEFLMHFVLRMGVSSSDAEDIVQEVFVYAHRSGGYRPGAASAKTWLARLAVNVVGTHRRTALRRREVADSDAGADVIAAGASPAEALEIAQSLARVQRILDSLSIEHRVVFVLFELEGESCAQIAAGLAIPIGTVYSRLHVARRAFLEADAEPAAHAHAQREVGEVHGAG